MALTNHENIRVEAGFQHRFSRDKFQSEPASGATVFHLRTDDPVKVVPNFNTGATVAGVSDIKVWCGLSGIGGMSRMTVSSIDVDQGSVTLSKSPDTGCSLTADYASSPLTSEDVERVRLRSESIINKRLSLCYDLPISPTPSVLTDYASRLASALLLMKGYGTGSRDTAVDGYALWDQLMGSGEIGKGDIEGNITVGEIGMICISNYQLTDDSGKIIPRNDDDVISGDGAYKSGGRIRGRLYDITEENFRYKEPQVDADANQPGSIKP